MKKFLNVTAKNQSKILNKLTRPFKSIHSLIQKQNLVEIDYLKKQKIIIYYYCQKKNPK